MFDASIAGMTFKLIAAKQSRKTGSKAVAVIYLWTPRGAARNDNEVHKFRRLIEKFFAINKKNNEIETRCDMVGG